MAGEGCCIMALKIHNILVLTSIYPASDIGKENTPVVHYFTKEWIKLGYNVVVVHYPSNFPQLMTFVASFFRKQISSKTGAVIRTEALRETEYVLDGVRVKRLPLLKYIPHKRYSNRKINNAFRKTVEFLSEIDFTPDVIISHWSNPQLEIMKLLKKVFKVPTCYVAHLNGNDILKLYSLKHANDILNDIDVIGFRSEYIKKHFLEIFSCKTPNFQCYSGIPDTYIEPNITRKYDKINSFIYVGTLIERKYPSRVVPAVYKAFKNENFSISYIGRGDEDKNIIALAKVYNIVDKVHLLGFMDRKSVVEHLKRNDVFIMISKKETFGLVYLEAMAVGCITIASRHEGFDGIIQDGVNGFLCEAGNSEELAEIILKIKAKTSTELNRISQNAIDTAKKYTEMKVAKNYIESIESQITNIN